MHSYDPPTVGVRLPHALQGDLTGLRAFVRGAEAAGITRLVLGDHVTFKGGQGFDALQNATAVAVLTDRVVVETAVYLLPLRHPVPVARQVAGLAALAPGRVIFGVGAGGEDPAELRACGVDPATRSRRMDESLHIVRALMTGESVSFCGQFFGLDGVQVLPIPARPVPVLVGGRSDAALRRTARYGDGWLGLWVSPQRYAQACAEVAARAAELGRDATSWQHGLHVWCGLGADRDSARARLAGEMESLYQVGFDKFEKYSPYGRPADIAEALWPYVEVGCRSFNLIATAERPEQVIDGAQQVQALLRELSH